MSMVLSVVDKQMLDFANLPITFCLLRFTSSFVFGLIYHWRVISPLRIFSLVRHFHAPGLCNMSNSVGFNMALYHSVVMTFVIKAGVPVFTATFGRIFFGIIFATGVYMSLAPIVIGIVIESWTDLDFNPVGCLCAVVSVSSEAMMGLTMKMSLTKADVPATMSQTLMVMASIFPALVVLAFSSENQVFWDAMNQFSEPKFRWLCLFSFVGYHIDSLAAILILSKVSNALTFHVLAVLRKLALIFFSVYWYRKELSFQNKMGISICLWGCILFNIMNAYSAGKMEGFGEVFSQFYASLEMSRMCGDDPSPRASEITPAQELEMETMPSEPAMQKSHGPRKSINFAGASPGALDDAPSFVEARLEKSL